VLGTESTYERVLPQTSIDSVVVTTVGGGGGGGVPVPGTSGAPDDDPPLDDAVAGAEDPLEPTLTVGAAVGEIVLATVLSSLLAHAAVARRHPRKKERTRRP